MWSEREGGEDLLGDLLLAIGFGEFIFVVPRLLTTRALLQMCEGPGESSTGVDARVVL